MTRATIPLVCHVVVGRDHTAGVGLSELLDGRRSNLARLGRQQVDDRRHHRRGVRFDVIAAERYRIADADRSVVTVTVVSDDAELRFAVSDDGAGFVIDRRAAGHGFVNMEDRVGAIGGRVEVDSAPGAGTQIRGFIPLGGSV